MNSKSKIVAIVTAVFVVTGTAFGVYFGVFYDPNNGNTNDSVVLELIGNGHSKNFTMDQIKAMSSYTGYGGFKNTMGNIRNYAQYKGVSFLTLLDEIGGITIDYALRVTASDFYMQDFSYSVVTGNVTTYDNTTGANLGYKILTMTLIYEELGTGGITDGPFRIGFLSPVGYVTDSAMWAKFVVKLELIAF